MTNRVTFPTPFLTAEQRDEIVEQRFATDGYWNYRRDLHQILSFPPAPTRGSGPCGCDFIVADISDHPDAQEFARLLDDYHEFGLSLLLGPLDSPCRLDHFFIFGDDLRQLKKRLGQSPVRILRDVDPAGLDRLEPWLVIVGGTVEQKAINFEFLSRWLDNAFSLAAARELQLMAFYDSDDGERLAVDISDAELVARSSWQRIPPNGRLWNGRDYLDRLLRPHDPLVESVIHINGNTSDFRRHNLAVEDQGDVLEVKLKREIVERLNKLGRPIEHLLADIVAWNG